MAANFLHGVETIEVKNGGVPITVVKSAVVGLVGIAPAGPVNEPVQILSSSDAAQFGSALSGFTIPQALDAIFDHGAGTVIVVNVLDPAVHCEQATDEVLEFVAVNGRANLAHVAVRELVLKDENGETTYAEGEDYTLSATSGLVTRLASGGIPAGGKVKATYKYADPSKVKAGDIIGGIDEDGDRTGFALLESCYQLFGYDPKILIAPGYCTQLSVASEMVAQAEKLQAMALIDAPVGATFDEAVTGRGPAGTINFSFASQRTVLCFPHLKVYSAELDADVLEPFSQRLAGVMCVTDNNEGYWKSPSNEAIQGITGAELSLTAKIDDAQSQVNLLNEKGILTVFNSYGSGWKVWGNRSSAWPTETDWETFICVRRTKDIIDESIRYSSAQFMDRPIDKALIDTILESVNQFFRKLQGDGAIMGGLAWFDQARNPDTKIKAGHLLIQYKFTPKPPLERLTYESELTGEYLVSLSGGE
ncbi:phage tail sheath subtilisin-like domain-containing protein [Desulfovibrio sp.]|jgi:phage tail sheath protein FI|uniref:phage tail sheath subtilisin-like domain-containing protein n=1 Tax=Desulfovibrio sp. TaxID=885 RepID=UPI0020558D91|nr:MAG TPA: sheath tube [Caudoviricetes sp.]